MAEKEIKTSNSMISQKDGNEKKTLPKQKRLRFLRLHRSGQKRPFNMD